MFHSVLECVDMKKLSREKLALIFFVFLILFGLGISLFYISTLSKPLNVAASNIDDATGNLEDYTAIVYEGLATEKKDAKNSGSNSNDSSSDLNKRAQTSNDSSEEVTASEAISDESNSEEEKETVSVRSVRKTYVEKGASVFEVKVADPREYQSKSIVKAGKFTFGILSVDKTTASTSADLEAYIQKRVKEYESLKIDFVVLVVSDLDLLTVSEDASSSASSTQSSDSSATKDATKDATSDATSETDSQATSTKDTSNSSASASSASSSSSTSSSSSSSTDKKSSTQTTKKQISLKGVDIVISTQDEGLNSGGVMVDGIFYNDAPLKKEVGTILISPSKTISAKDIS